MSNRHISICYISTHSPELVIRCNGLVQESTRFSGCCVRLSLASQLQRFGYLAAFTGWIAGPAIERGNELVQECPKAPHSPQPHCRLQHGRIGRFPDRASDSDGYCDSFAHAFVSNVPAQRRGRALIRHAEIYAIRSSTSEQASQIPDAGERDWLACRSRFER